MIRRDHIRNEKIRHRLQQRSNIDVVRDTRESCRVKVTKKPKSLLGKAMTGEVRGRQLRGRPRKWSLLHTYCM